MIRLKVEQYPPIPPSQMMTHAARFCYTSEPPDMGEVMNIKDQLFDTGHHTTGEHSCYTFSVDGISVGDITFGLHLCNPFYNSDQRSWRFTKIADAPDKLELAAYIRSLWPEVKEYDIWRILDYVDKCFELFMVYKKPTEDYTAYEMGKTRPHYKKGLGLQIEKIAQEQRRVFMPVIMPTGLDYTINLITIVAMYRSAFTPGLRQLTGMMADAVVQHDPELRFMFERDEPDFWSPRLPDDDSLPRDEPLCQLLDIDSAELYVEPKPTHKFPVDQLYFRPEYMDMATASIKTRKVMSVMTMGQDQRHRTLHRGTPEFSGGIYMPPLLDKCQGAGEDLFRTHTQWLNLAKDLPPSLAAMIAPYGARIAYLSRGNLLAVCHEQGKRLCWNAQEEIRNLALQLRQGIIAKLGDKSPLVKMLEPPCFRGKCLEGGRYCGRRVKARRDDRYFKRQVI